MKLKNVAVVVAALVLAVGMTACGGSSSTAASSTAESAASSVASVSASSEAASSEAASSEAASSEAASSEAASSEAESNAEADGSYTIGIGQFAVDRLHPHAEALRRFPAVLFKRFRWPAGKGPEIGPLLGEAVQHGVADAPVCAGQHDILSFQKQAGSPFLMVRPAPLFSAQRCPSDNTRHTGSARSSSCPYPAPRP